MNIRRACRNLSIVAIVLTILSSSLPPVFSQAKPAAPVAVSASSPHRKNEPDDVERVETNLVTVPVSVMDRVGRYITDLRKEDFQIFEDGVEQEVALFAPVEQPFTVFFLLDTSGSMELRMEDLANAANTFVGQLRSEDQLVAISFDDWVKVLFDTTKVGNLQKVVKLRQPPKPMTTLVYDAVDYAFKRVKKVRGRKAIILFSDGVGSGIVASAKRNLHDAEELDALVYTVQFNTHPAEPPPYVNRAQYLKRIEDANYYMQGLARKTGGRHYLINNLADLGQTFGLVADELRRQYSLGYYPKKRAGADATRKIKVKVRHRQDVAVQARESYLAR